MNDSRAGGKNRLYFDVCTLCRPFDDQRALRIRLETDAFHLMVQAVRRGAYEMVASPAHFQELSGIRDRSERRETMMLLTSVGKRLAVDLPQAQRRAEILHSQGFGPVDAAHVAYAEATSDFFITCDDKLLKRCRRIVPSLHALNPVEFSITEELR